MTKDFFKDKPVQILNVGTKILVKDVMDQYLRSLGDVKTYYASKLSVAIESYHEKRQEVVFCEQSFPEGGALDFIDVIGGLDTFSDRYFILAVESPSDALFSLAMEKGIDELLVKPFNTENIWQIMERYAEKRKISELVWVKELRAAQSAYLEKRFQEADELFGSAARKHWNNSGVLLDVAQYFFARQQTQKSVPLLERVLQDFPENVRALNLYGSVLKRLGKFQDAIRHFKLANQFSSLNNGRNVEMADAYVSLAEEQILSALKFDSESSSLILRRAQYQLLRRDYGSLVNYLESKRSFISDSARKEADGYAALAKKLGGLK